MILLNDDVVIARDFIAEAVGAAAADPRAATVTGPVYYYDDPEGLSYAGGEILWSRAGRAMGGGAVRAAAIDLGRQLGAADWTVAVDEPGDARCRETVAPTEQARPATVVPRTDFR